MTLAASNSQLIDYKDIDNSVLNLALSRITPVGTFNLKSRRPFIHRAELIEELMPSGNRTEELTNV